MQVRAFPTPNGAGWELDVRRFAVPGRLDPTRRPLLLIPGYCMNTLVLGFHPEGLSMIEFLAQRGFEVWTANLRTQGGSRSTGGSRECGFAEMALHDLPQALEAVLKRTDSHAQRVDVIGCSLGGTFVYTCLAHRADDNRIGSVVSMGAPLRWDCAHPLVRFVFGSRRVANAIPIRGTRRMARYALPVARRIPGLLDLYMNTRNIDLSATDQLVQTVDDPIRRLNGEIAQWIKSVDLTVDGVNVTYGLKSVNRPLMCVLANADGVVPPESALSVVDAIGTDDVEVLRVGDATDWFAHADMFISRHAQARVFEPIASWLESKGTQ